MPCFYDEGLYFSCQKCSHCCRKEPGFVYLSQRDLTKLCLCFNLNEDQFIAMYCRKVPYYDGTTVLALREKTNYDCIFWKDGCSVYKDRPIQCSTYPFWTWILEDKEMWDSMEKGCPGINNGKLCKKADILKKLKMYEDNKLITF